MEGEAHNLNLLPVVALLGAAVIAAPLFQRLGLGSVLGYLAAGVAIGPLARVCSKSRSCFCTSPSSAW